MKKQNEVGVEFPEGPRKRDPMLGVNKSAMLCMIPGNGRGGVNSFSASSLTQLVRQVRPTLRTTVRTPQGAQLGTTESELREQRVRLEYGQERPSRIEEDFLESGLVWKTVREDLPARTSEVERRPFLAGRLERAALERILQEIWAMKRRGGDGALLDSTARRGLAAQLRKRCEALGSLRELHGRNTKEGRG